MSGADRSPVGIEHRASPPGTPHCAALPGDGPLLRRRFHHLPEESRVDPGPTGETAAPAGKAHFLRRSSGKRGERSSPLSFPDTSRLQAPRVPPSQGRDRGRIHASTQAQLGPAYRTDVARRPGDLLTVRGEDGSPGRHLLTGPGPPDRENPPLPGRVGSPLETAPESPRPAPIDFGISGDRGWPSPRRRARGRRSSSPRIRHRSAVRGWMRGVTTGRRRGRLTRTPRTPLAQFAASTKAPCP